jgi:hypothetical protein
MGGEVDFGEKERLAKLRAYMQANMQREMKGLGEANGGSLKAHLSPNPKDRLASPI